MPFDDWNTKILDLRVEIIRDSQESSLTPQFKIYTEYFMRNASLAESQIGLKISWRKSNNFVYPDAAAAAKSLQSCLTLHDPIDGSPSGSPVPGILQSRALEWVAISFSHA